MAATHTHTSMPVMTDSVESRAAHCSPCRTQTTWLLSVTLWPKTTPCSGFTRVTSSGCRLWMDWRRVRHCITCSQNPAIFWLNRRLRTEPVCPCRTLLGFSYGCVVKKMVVFLEEMKRDTSDFGEDLLINFIEVFLFKVDAKKQQPAKRYYWVKGKIRPMCQVFSFFW